MPNPHREKLRTLALAWGAMLGPAGFARVVAHFGSTREALAAEPESLRAPQLRLSPQQQAVIPTLAHRLDEFQRELEALEAAYIRVLCRGEDGYPPLLAELRDAPPVICMVGRLLPEDDPALAIVGTRTPSPDGYDISYRVAQAMARTGTTVVSGLARGCDTAAHLGALEAGGRTIAVLGSGIRVIHPRANLGLARQISQRGAVLSEQPPDAHPSVARLMARNRLQSALARGVLVVESGEQGGAMETARRAIEQGRELFAVPWTTDSPKSAGPAKLLREGAFPVPGPEVAPQVRLRLVDHIGRMQRRQRPAGGQMALLE